MNVSYTLTFDDYREATRAHQIGVGKRVTRIGTLLLVAGIITAEVLFGFATISPPAHSSTEAVLSGFGIATPFLIFVASLLVFGLLYGRVVIEPRNVVVKSSTASGKRRRGTFGWILLFGAAIIFSMLRSNSSADQDPAVAAWAAGLSQKLPWICMVAMLVLFAYCSQLGALGRAWRALPNLRGQHDAEIVAEHVVIATPVSRSQLMWNGIRCFVESENLFLLYPNLLSFHIIPKRAFPDEAQITAFRNMLDHLVKPAKLGP
jgi:hypothetical protein